jgi:hypothetical protein
MAQASDNLLQLLDLPDSGRVMPAAAPGEARLVLSRTAWRTLYHSDPHLVGHTADIDGRPVLIAGIIPDGDWGFAGKIDAVLLEDQRSLAVLPSRTRGFVVARIRNSAFPPPRGGWRKMVETRDKVTRGFDCISVTHLLGQPSFVFLFAMLMALLALPATTALPLGDYPRRRDHLPGTVNAQRWGFLIAKFAGDRHRRPLLHRSGLRLLRERPRLRALHSAGDGLPCSSVRLSLDTAGSAEALPRMPASVVEPGSRRSGLVQFSVVEWHRTVLC